MSIIFNRKQILVTSLLTILLVSKFYVANSVVPTREWFEYIGKPNYEELMPDKFSDWERISDSYERITVSPEIERRVNELYTSTVSRIYKNNKNQKVIMVSLAYGSDQMFPNQVHRPDACYPAQGFKIVNKLNSEMQYNAANLPLSNLIAKRQFRTENVTYWIRLGNGVANSTMSLHYNRIELAAKGYRADGLLFRISEISDNSTESFKTQKKFITDFLNSLSQDNLSFFIGDF